jgi:hypothetical protein
MMKYILEYKKFSYGEGDEVLIHYWYDGHITPVKILEKTGRRFLVSHNVHGSKIQNAPDEFIKSTEIIDKYRKKQQ